MEMITIATHIHGVWLPQRGTRAPRQATVPVSDEMKPCALFTEFGYTMECWRNLHDVEHTM